MATKKSVGNQWEFSIPGYNNKLCKSISQIDESFKNSKGTEIITKANRYRAILCKIADCSNLFDLLLSVDVKDKQKLQKIREKFSKITYIIVSFSDVFYKLDGKFSGGSYTKYMPKVEGFSKYLDFKYDITKKIIQDKNSEMSMYKKMGNGEGQNIIRQDIIQYAKKYVTLYRGRESIVGVKRIGDIFFEQNDFVFDSLNKIIFVDNSKTSPLNYISVLNNSVLATNIEQVKKTNNILDFTDELTCLKRYAKTLEASNSRFKNLSKIYLIPNDSENLNNFEFIQEKAKSGLIEDYLVYEYIVPVSMEDKKKEQEIQEYLEKSKTEIKKCLYLINKMNYLVKDGSIISDISNPTEKALWASYLNFNAVKNNLEYLIKTIKENKDNSFGNWMLEEGNLLSLTSLFVTNSVSPDISCEKEIQYFLSYVPSYLFDNRRSNKIEITTVKDAEKVYSNYSNCCKLLFGILELFLGVQMGTLAIYMKRYGFQGMDFVLNLFPSIKETSICTTRNITTLAEYCLYKNLHVSAIKSDVNYYENPEGEALLGPLKGFASVAFKRVADYTSVSDYVLEHSSKEDSKAAKVKNLLQVLDYMESLFKEYHAFFHID